MRVLNREDYEKLARPVVTEFVEGNTPLEDNLVKTSMSAGLNPDQIKALVQVANTLAHLDLFDRKDGGDKVVEFSPADPKEVLHRVYNGEKLEKVRSECGEPELMDFFGEMPEDETPCEAVCEDSDEEESPKKRQLTIIKIRKVAEELNYRKTAAALEYEEEVDKLAAEFARLYGPDFGSFEKDAVDLRGSNAIPVLSDIRNLLRMPPVDPNSFDKTARLVDGNTPELEKLGRLVELAEEAKNCEAGLVLLKNKYGSDL